MAMHFDLVDLRLMVRIAETNGLTRGAEASHMSLPAASTRVKNLEESIGTKLLYRTSQGVTLTPPGQAFVHHARLVLGQLEHLRADLQEYARGIRGHLRVVANASAIAECLPPDLAAFSRAHPEIRISLEDQTSAELQRSVAEGAADVGIFVPPLLEPARLQTWSYRDGTLVLITPAGHALAQQPAVRFADLLEHDFIGQHTGAALQQMLLAQATELGRPLRARMQVRGFDAIAQLVEAGLGIALMPSAVAQRLARLFRLEIVALDEPWARRDYRVGVRAQEVLPAVVRRFVAFLCPAAFVSADEPSPSLFPSPHPSSPTENPS